MMKVMIVDKSAPSFQLLGRMEAQVGMFSTAGNEIKSVNGNSCTILIDGKLKSKREVCIDLTEARKFGWSQNGAENVMASAAGQALARNAKAASQPSQPKSPAPKLKRDAEFWKQKAEERLRLTSSDLRPFDARLNKSNLQEYDYRITRGLENRQWAAVLRVLAELVRKNSLPPVLHGLTNEQQVRTLMRWDETNKWQREPHNMGPTIRTPEQLKEAAGVIQSIMPALEPDPNPDPRKGTKYEKGNLIGK